MKVRVDVSYRYDAGYNDPCCAVVRAYLPSNDSGYLDERLRGADAWGYALNATAGDQSGEYHLIETRPTAEDWAQLQELVKQKIDELRDALVHNVRSNRTAVSSEPSDKEVFLEVE
jgi:hypothetical protein